MYNIKIYCDTWSRTLIFQVMINFWSRPGTQLVITTLTVKSGRTRSHITSKEETRRVWLSVITCWRIIMAWRKWSTLYQKIMSCYRSVYTEINCVSSRLPVIYNKCTLKFQIAVSVEEISFYLFVCLLVWLRKIVCFAGNCWNVFYSWYVWTGCCCFYQGTHDQ